VHNYTSSECGYMALQCPEHDHLHVQSELLLIEVLDANDRPCQPGEVGRVVVTPLHGFATPLIRCEIGDEAEVGEPCACGRGLPVLKRIVGRTYDYLVTVTGKRKRVDTGYYRICRIPVVREFQLVQRSVELIELRVVLARPLTSEEVVEIHDVMRAEFGPEFRVEIAVLESIPRTNAGKLRSFVSEVASAK
jgi:phenylacetate-CoA ligase